MKKLEGWLIIIFLGCGICEAQNLVPNPSFEDTIGCPSGYNQVSNATGWFIARQSPDYFNTCATWSGVSVPQNDFGLQYPPSGNAYMGFFAKSHTSSNYREHIGISLPFPIQIGT